MRSREVWLRLTSWLRRDEFNRELADERLCAVCHSVPAPRQQLSICGPAELQAAMRSLLLSFRNGHHDLDHSLT